MYACTAAATIPPPHPHTHTHARAHGTWIFELVRDVHSFRLVVPPRLVLPSFLVQEKVYERIRSVRSQGCGKCTNRHCPLACVTQAAGPWVTKRVRSLRGAHAGVRVHLGVLFGSWAVPRRQLLFLSAPTTKVLRTSHTHTYTHAYLGWPMVLILHVHSGSCA